MSDVDRTNGRRKDRDCCESSGRSDRWTERQAAAIRVVPPPLPNFNPDQADFQVFNLDDYDEPPMAAA